MKNCSKDILKFHADDVTLPKPEQDKVRGNRNANRDRLKRGLDANDKSQPDEFVFAYRLGRCECLLVCE